MIPFLDLNAQYLSIRDEIDAAIAAVIADSAFIGGKYLQAFEAEFADYQQAKHCIGVGNGTDALEILIEALEFPTGSEIIVPANSFVASGEAVTRAGHRVVFADVDPETYMLDLADVARRITDATAAVMAVHLYGLPGDMEALTALAEKHGVALIEDCAQAHGAEYRGRRVGTFGVGGTFSFYPGKNLGAYGDGGAVVSNDSALALRCREIANHGRTSKYDHRFEGRNSRLDGLQAAILGAKLKHLDGWLDARAAVASGYLKGLQGVGDIVLPTLPADRRHAFHLFVIRTSSRDALRDHLARDGIASGIHYPIALTKLLAYQYLGQGNERLRANEMDEQLLSLPIGEHLDGKDVEKVVDSIGAFYAR